MKRLVKRPKIKIKRGDIVMAIAGEDAAGKKTGKVLQILPARNQAIVEGFHYVKKHMRKSQNNPQGGIVEKEAPIAISNLKLFKRADEKPAHKPKEEAQSS